MYTAVQRGERTARSNTVQVLINDEKADPGLQLQYDYSSGLMVATFSSNKPRRQ